MASRHPTYLNEAQRVAMQPDDDELDQTDGLQEAIEQSLRARTNDEVVQSTSQKTQELDPPVHTCQNRVSIEDRINAMTKQAAVQLPTVYDPMGDTLIYIDPPQRQPEQDEYDYEHYIKRYTVPILMKKHTLTRYSPGLAKLFGPTQQFRFRRRRKLANKLPANVKYVIDLTPPSEGEDAVFLTTELCCSEGVRLWSQSNQIWNVSKTLVEGAEEYSSVSPNPVSRPLLQTSYPVQQQRISKPTESKELGGLKVPVGSNTQATSSTTLPLEYSPVRHRYAIERVLSALQGKDPILDSATKVWTTFAVAKNFEITHSPLEDYIIRWLRAYPNSYFLEVLPEVSHQIADGLQNCDLARESFAILVGEEALDSLRDAQKSRSYTRFGRKKEALPEQIHTRIEYASKSFLERINNDFEDFVANGMRWIDDLPEVRRLSAYTQPELQQTIQKLKDLLKDYVHGTLYRVLYANYGTVPGPDLHRDGGHDLLPRVDRATVWATMSLGERILSRTYWDALRSFTLLQGVSNFDIQNGWDLKSGLNRFNQVEMSRLDRCTYRKIKNSELEALIRTGQTHLDKAAIQSPNLRHNQQESSAEPFSTQLQTLPDRTITRTQGQNQSEDLLLTHTPGSHLYNAQRESNFESLQKQSYTLPDRTLNGTQEVAMRIRAPISSSSQPIQVPKSLKRTQHSAETLSPQDKPREFESHRKRPFGAVRNDLLAQVQKRVDGLHFSSVGPGGPSATDHTLEESLGQGPRNEWSPVEPDPGLGYNDQLSHANDDLQSFLKPEPPRSPTKASLGQKVVPAGLDIWTGYNEVNGDGGVQQQLEETRPMETNFAINFFSLESFFFQARIHIDMFAMDKLRSSDQLELGIVNTLVCLEDSEWKYLPLWAGGNDDGSMGVYNDDLPTAEHGFTTAGPEVHDGSTPANSAKAPSEFEFVSAGDSASTFNASTATNRGFSDTVRRGHVHAVDSADDSASGSFTMVTPSVDSDDEETIARKQIEAQERIEEAEEAAANEARRIAKGKGKMVEEDESYADLFEGEEEEDGNDTDRAEINDEDEEDMVLV